MMATHSIARSPDAGPPPFAPPSSTPLSVASTEQNDATEARLRAIVDAHYDFIWRSLRALGVASGNVDDATQRVFLVAAQKLGAIASGSERSFLFSTARGVAANDRRSRSRSPELLDENAMLKQIDDAPGPEQLASRTQAREILMRILEAMEDDIRTVFVLFELEGLTTTDIAEVLGLAPGTVASRLRRAREEFQAATKRFHASQRGTS